MSVEAIVRILREGLMLVLLLSAGPMLASMLIGLVMSILQATISDSGPNSEFRSQARRSISSAKPFSGRGSWRSPFSSPWFFLKRYRRCARESTMLAALQHILASIGFHDDVGTFIVLFGLIVTRLVTAITLTPFMGERPCLRKSKWGWPL